MSDFHGEHPEFPPLSKDEIKEIKEAERLLAKVENKKLRKHRKKPRTPSEKEIFYENLRAKIREYMNSYILVGFSVDGEDIVHIEISDSLEQHALKDLLRDFNNRGTLFRRLNKNNDDDFEDEEDDEFFEDDDDF